MGVCGCCSGSQTAAEPAEPYTFFFKKRGCTDCFCLILFFAFWAGLFYITYLSLTVGDPYAVLYGKDYLGNRCGVGTMVGKPALYLPRIDKDIIAQSAIASTMPWKLKFYGLCVEDCPNVTTPEACFANPDDCKVYDYGTPAQYGPAGGKAAYYATMQSINLINRCIPNDANALSQEPDRCAFPQCDGVNYAPCDPDYPTTWQMKFPESLNCEVVFRVGEIKQLRMSGVSTVSNAIGSKVASAQKLLIALVDAMNELLLFGVAMPVVLGFVWLVLLRLFAGIFTYIMIIAIGVALALLSAYLWLRAGIVDELLALGQNLTLPAGMNITDEQAAAMNNSLALALGIVSSTEDALASIAPSSLTSTAASAQNQVPALWIILAAVMTIITLIYTISMCAARKQIKTAIALVKESSMVIKARPQMMFFPFNTLVAQIAVAFYFVLLVLFLRTANLTIDHFQGVVSGMTAAASFLDEMQLYNSTMLSGGVAALENSDKSALYVQLILGLYILFGFLWTIESCNNIGWTALSGSVSHWYFFREDPEAKTRVPLLRSLGRVFRYHLGSVFFGSFIIALIQLVRIILQAIDRYTKKQQKANFLLKLAIKCCQLCLWCFEKTVKFITNYCFIYIAMQGAGFCKACFLTFSLIVTNPAQLAINTFVRTILGWIQLLGLPVASGWTCNLWLTNRGAPEIVAPTVVVAVCAYIIAKVFSTVFACVLDTLFVCCCRDKADYKGKYMPDRLKAVYGFKKGKKKKKAEEEAEGGGGEDGGEEAK